MNENSLNVVYRQFRSNDLGSVIAINRRCLPENYAPSFFMNIYENFPKTFLVSEVNNQVVGYIMCRIEYGPSDFGNFDLIKKGHIISIAVLPEYRRRKIATNLILNAMERMKEYDAQEVFLEVRISNEQAISLYKKLGFQIVRKIPMYYLDGEDAYMMARVL